MAWIKGMNGDLVSLGDWIPACAGMTVEGAGMTVFAGPACLIE